MRKGKILYCYRLRKDASENRLRPQHRYLAWLPNSRCEADILLFGHEYDPGATKYSHPAGLSLEEESSLLL